MSIYTEDDLDKFRDGEPRGVAQCRRTADNGDWCDHRNNWHSRDGMPDEDEVETEDEDYYIETEDDQA